MSEGSQYQAAQSYQFQNSPDQLRGQQLAQTSMILGILSLFVLGVVLGPIAIVKASQAEKLNTGATVGKVTGWIGTIMGALSVVGSIIFFVIFMVAAGSADFTTSP